MNFELPKINEVHADFVLSYAKNGLVDLARDIKVNEDKDCVEVDLSPTLVEKFSMKFPDTDLVELDNVVQWIIIKSLLLEKEKN